MTTTSLSCHAPPFPAALPPTLPAAALAYAAAGLPVFPLVPHKKTPCVSRGFHAATTDLACIRQWWDTWPDANIGIPTGQASGLVVLDVDPRHGGQTSLRHLQHALDHHAADLSQPRVDLRRTCLQRSGGAGLHLFFAWDAQLPLRTNTRFAGYAGLDLRADGGYIVVAPSLHPGGGRYAWLTPSLIRQPHPFPDALLSLLHTRQRALALTRWEPHSLSAISRGKRDAFRRDPAFWLEWVLRRVVIGNRHDQALFLACRLIQDGGLSQEEAVEWMHAYACRVPQGCDPRDHYPVHDALACLAWASTHVR